MHFDDYIFLSYCAFLDKQTALQTCSIVQVYNDVLRWNLTGASPGASASPIITSIYIYNVVY